MNIEHLAPILDWIEMVVQGLGLLADSTVFVGGAVTSLLITDADMKRVRPTKDIDVIVNITRSGYYKLEDELRMRGFVQMMSGNDPICRWHYGEVMLDIMPTDESILKFVNRWYKSAFKHAVWFELPSGARIRLISAPLFLCTKLEAFADRGQGNFEESHDIEDVVTVIDGRPELTKEVHESPADVRMFLSESFQSLLKSDRFMSSIEWHLPYGAGGLERVSIIEKRMKAITERIQ